MARAPAAGPALLLPLSVEIGRSFVIYWGVSRLSFLLGFLFVGLSLVLPGRSSGFGEMAGACEPDCQKCHTISRQQATEIIRKLNPEIEVLDVGPAPVRGLWEVAIKGRGDAGIAYIDFSLRHVIAGRVFEVSADSPVPPRDVTSSRLYEINKIDRSAIPLDDALLLGSAEARWKAIVFDDPD